MYLSPGQRRWQVQVSQYFRHHRQLRDRRDDLHPAVGIARALEHGSGAGLAAAATAASRASLMARSSFLVAAVVIALVSLGGLEERSLRLSAKTSSGSRVPASALSSRCGACSFSRGALQR
jgi:hypothetical protein